MMRCNLGRRSLIGDRRGVAAVEFALWLVLFFIVMLGAFDIGQYVIERSRLAQAMSGASLAAFKSRDAVNFAGLPAYLRAGSGLPNPASLTVTVKCNGSTGCTNTNRTCACLSKTGTLVAASTCGTSCGTGATASSTSGYYLQITASHPYQTAVLPQGVLTGTVVEQKTTVRLQ